MKYEEPIMEIIMIIERDVITLSRGESTGSGDKEPWGDFHNLDELQ